MHQCQKQLTSFFWNNSRAHKVNYLLLISQKSWIIHTANKWFVAEKRINNQCKSVSHTAEQMCLMMTLAVGYKHRSALSRGMWWDFIYSAFVFSCSWWNPHAVGSLTTLCSRVTFMFRTHIHELKSWIKAIHEFRKVWRPAEVVIEHRQWSFNK